MTSSQVWLLWIYAAIIAIWPIRHVALYFIFKKLHVLTPGSPRLDPSSAPKVTAIIPAKDEERTLAACLSSVCAQDYPDLEIIVVDDRSTDQTGAIAHDYAAKDARITVLEIESLPVGWTGKTNALHQAVELASGEWYWFLDSDTQHAPENLSIVMEYARTQKAVMASLLPEMRCESFWENVVQPLAGIVLMQSYPLFRVNNDRSSLAFANGQYILIKRSAYDAIGGHRSVRDQFVEDIRLAERLKQEGYPIRVAVARGIGSTRMYSSLDQLIRGWSRILYDALGRSPIRLLGRLLDPLIFSQTGHLALLAALVLLIQGNHGPFALTLLGMSLVHHLLSYSVLTRVYHQSVPKSRYVAWFPVANLVMDLILLRAIRMCLTGQVTWRGTCYGPTPLGTRPVSQTKTVTPN